MVTPGLLLPHHPQCNSSLKIPSRTKPGPGLEVERWKRKGKLGAKGEKLLKREFKGREGGGRGEGGDGASPRKSNGPDMN